MELPITLQAAAATRSAIHSDHPFQVFAYDPSEQVQLINTVDLTIVYGEIVVDLGFAKVELHDVALFLIHLHIVCGRPFHSFINGWLKGWDRVL